MAPRPESTGRLSEDKLGYELATLGLKEGCDYFRQKVFEDELELKPTGERIRWDLFFPGIRGFKNGLVVEVKRQLSSGTCKEKIATSILCCVVSKRPAFLVLEGRQELTSHYEWVKRIIAGKDKYIADTGSLLEVMWMDEFIQWLHNSASLFEREQAVFSVMDASPVSQARRTFKTLFE